MSVKGSSSSTSATPLNSEFPYSWNTSSADSGAQNTSMISASCDAHTSVHRHARMHKSHTPSLAARRVLPESARMRTRSSRTRALALALEPQAHTRMHAHAHVDMLTRTHTRTHTNARKFSRTRTHAKTRAGAPQG